MTCHVCRKESNVHSKAVSKLTPFGGKQKLKISVLFQFAVPIYSTICPNGIFIWWPQFEHINVAAYIIQFWHNDSTNPTVFADHIVGTSHWLDEIQTWTDIEGHLEKFPATTNVYPGVPLLDRDQTMQKRRRATNGNQKRSGHRSQMDSDAQTKKSINRGDASQNETITEVRVSGNVTGILIPNTKRIVVRVLVPIYDENGEMLNLDTTFVEWKFIEETPGDAVRFQLGKLEARSVQFIAANRSIDCAMVCYRNPDLNCQQR